ncbi:MAG: signal peptidase I [Firmicutes bacterium]|nr:signal peptidase I [Bacillota bacterium]
MAKKQAGENIDKEKQGGALHKAGTALGILLILLLLPMIACNVTLIVKSFLRPEKVPTIFGVAPLIVLSGSMREEIQVNDLIFVKEQDPDTLEVGDVIAYQSVDRGKETIAHRIIGITTTPAGRRQFTTKGDNNNAADTDPVETYQVVGRYFLRLPGLGKAAQFLQTTWGIILSVGIPMLLFLIYDVVRRTRYRRGGKYIDNAEFERLSALAAKAEEAPAQEENPHENEK